MAFRMTLASWYSPDYFSSSEPLELAVELSACSVPLVCRRFLSGASFGVNDYSSLKQTCWNLRSQHGLPVLFPLFFVLNILKIFDFVSDDASFLNHLENICYQKGSWSNCLYCFFILSLISLNFCKLYWLYRFCLFTSIVFLTKFLRDSIC